MKTYSIFASALLPWLTVHADSKEDIRRDASTLLKRAGASKAWDEMSSNEYFKGLRELAARAGKLDWNPQVTAHSDIITAFLGMAIAYPKIQEQVTELSDWYGRTQAEVPKVRREQQLAPLPEAARNGRVPKPTLDSSQYGKMHVQRVELVHHEHKAAAYKPAWEVWLMAPSGRERWMMKAAMQESLAVIGHPASIPLLVEAVRCDASRRGEKKFQCYEVLGTISVLRAIGGEEGLTAILACHRMAIANGYAGEETESISSGVAGILTSPPAYVDSDPKKRELAEEKDKAFKQLIAAKAAQAEELPKEDQVLLNETMKHMSQRPGK